MHAPIIPGYGPSKLKLSGCVRHNEQHTKQYDIMDISAFADKSIIPTNEDLISTLGDNYDLWTSLKNFVVDRYPPANEEWNFSGKKYGWSFRIKDKKRVIIYLLPRDKYFKVAFVFGQKTTEQILSSDIPAEIKLELENAKVYAEGRGIRVDVRDSTKLIDIKKLIEIKLAN